MPEDPLAAQRTLVLTQAGVELDGFQYAAPELGPSSDLFTSEIYTQLRLQCIGSGSDTTSEAGSIPNSHASFGIPRAAEIAPVPMPMELDNFMSRPNAKKRPQKNTEIKTGTAVSFDSDESALGATSNCRPRRSVLAQQAVAKRRTKAATFACPHCEDSFTTQFRRGTHINRFHTPEDQQKRRDCDTCQYITYFSDISRHSRKCRARSASVRYHP
ncbi:hypothetical protein BDZ97DRAFT_2070837 [Flammula alnicola]|nr:hypothetical protein BDZ97DRAFT_2070837 [Flammula alnicola]